MLVVGFGFRIAPGLRVYPSSRGLGVAMRAGPVGYNTRASVSPNSGRSSSGRHSVAAYARRMLAAERQQDIEAVLALDQELQRMCELHKKQLPSAQPPAAAVAGGVDEKAIRRELEKGGAQGVPLFRFGERKAARQRAREKLEGEIAVERAAEQAELDAAWRRLLGNDRETVVTSLEEAFEDNESPAIAVNCAGARVDLVMLWPILDAVVSDRRYALTPSGKPTHRKRSKTDRYELYLEAMASNALATVNEAFALAPGLDEAALLVLRKVEGLAAGDDVIEPLYAGVIERRQLEAIDWERVAAAAALSAMPNSTIGLKGRSKELRAIDLSDDPAAAATVNELAIALGARSRYGVPGLVAQ